MSHDQPPALATTILERSNVDAALIGDLIEQYRAGRSAVWYWSQVPKAVLFATFRDIRRHYILALGAWAIGFFGTQAIFSLAGPFIRVVGLAGNNWLLEAGHEGLRWLWWRLAMPNAITNLVTMFFLAWLVARLLRPHSVAMVAAFSTLFLYVDAKILIIGVILNWDRPFLFRQEVWYLAANIVIHAVAIPFGALLGAGRPQVRPPVEEHVATRF